MRAIAMLAVVLGLAAGCNQLLGGKDLTLAGGDAAGGGDGPGPGSDATAVDAAAGCVPGPTQCTNCIDDDADGALDSSDIECTSADDNDEGSFGTGIPGDNADVSQQDCFFDGNSGAGDDNCLVHVCCILGATSVAQCPISAGTYNPQACPPPIGTGSLPATCISVCSPRAPEGCDCFGCCTVCDPATNQCTDIALHPMVSPGCDESTLFDTTKCKQCTKIPSCGRATCGGNSCILCAGQTVADLPAACGGQTACGAGEPSCPDGACPTGAYCDETGDCCIGGTSP